MKKFILPYHIPIILSCLTKIGDPVLPVNKTERGSFYSSNLKPAWLLHPKFDYSYEGELQNFKPHGLGTLRKVAETYTGNFSRGEEHSRGKELVDGFAIEGIWENGKLITLISKNPLTDDELMNDLDAWLARC